jgi:hypothetical protein
MTRNCCCAGLSLLAGWRRFAQSAEGSESRGFTFYERFQGGVNSLRAVNELDSNSLDTIFFGVSFNLGKAIRSLGI